MLTLKVARKKYIEAKLRYNPTSFDFIKPINLCMHSPEALKPNISSFSYGSERAFIRAAKKVSASKDIIKSKYTLDIDDEAKARVIDIKSMVYFNTPTVSIYNIPLNIIYGRPDDTKVDFENPDMLGILTVLAGIMHKDSISCMLYQLFTVIPDEVSFEDMVSFEYIKKDLESTSRSTVRCICNGRNAYCINNAASRAFVVNSSQYINTVYIYGIELMYIYSNISDNSVKQVFENLLVKSYNKSGAENLLYFVEDGHVRLTSTVTAVMEIHNAKDRFEAIKDILEKVPDTMEYTKYCNPLIEMFMQYMQSYSLMTVREGVLEKLYCFVQDNELLKDIHGLSDGLADLLPKVMGLDSSTSSDSEKTCSDTPKELMYDNTSSKSDRVPTCTHPKVERSATSEALDSAKLKYADAGILYTCEDIYNTSDVAKAKYNAALPVVNLIKNNLTRSLRDMKTYNTGGKNTGKSTGKLDRKALYRYKTDKNIFYDNTYKQKESDLAFGIVLDISGSMSGNGIKNGRLTMIVLHEVLKALKINHSIIAHTTYGGMHTCDITRYQSFNEDKTFHTPKNYALAGLSAKCGNCDSGALYYMHKALNRVHNKDKVCLMFSDGEPTECTVDELRKEVANTEADGIHVIGIGVNFPNISRYYTTFANGKNIQDMLDIITKILKEFLFEKDKRSV